MTSRAVNIRPLLVGTARQVSVPAHSEYLNTRWISLYQNSTVQFHKDLCDNSHQIWTVNCSVQLIKTDLYSATLLPMNQRHIKQQNTQQQRNISTNQQLRKFASVYQKIATTSSYYFYTRTPLLMILHSGVISSALKTKKWNFRTQCLQNFRTISGHFCRFHEAQDTENACFFLSSLCYSLKQISIAVLKMLLRHCYQHTKAKTVVSK